MFKKHTLNQLNIYSVCHINYRFWYVLNTTSPSWDVCILLRVSKFDNSHIWPRIVSLFVKDKKSNCFKLCLYHVMVCLRMRCSLLFAFFVFLLFIWWVPDVVCCTRVMFLDSLDVLSSLTLYVSAELVPNFWIMFA